MLKMSTILYQRLVPIMPSIVHGGLRYIQTRHAIYCKNCNLTIESKSIHDFKWCQCGSVGVDGGICDGNTILGKLEDMEPRSMYCAYVNKKKFWLPQEVIEQQFSLLNNKVNAIL
jgi:hypothetical protein